MLKRYIGRVIQSIQKKMRVHEELIDRVTNQWLDIELRIYHGYIDGKLCTTTKPMRLYLDVERLNFFQWVNPLAGECIDIHLSDLFEIGLDHRPGQSYMAGAGWSISLLGLGIKDGGIYHG